MSTPDLEAQKIEDYCNRAFMAAHLGEDGLVESVLSGLDEEFGVKGMIGAMFGWVRMIERYHSPECIRNQPAYNMIQRDEHGQERLAVPESHQGWPTGRALQIMLATMRKDANEAIDLFEDAIMRSRGPDVVCAMLAATAILVGRKLEDDVLQWEQSRAHLN